MQYKDFIIRKIGNQFFAYYQGKTKGFTALAKGGQLSLLGDYFLSLAAIQSSIRSFHNKNTRLNEYIAPAIYPNGALLLAYRTGHGNGKEIEFLNHTFNCMARLKAYAERRRHDFLNKELLVYQATMDKPLTLVDVINDDIGDGEEFCQQ